MDKIQKTQMSFLIYTNEIFLNQFKNIFIKIKKDRKNICFQTNLFLN